MTQEKHKILTDKLKRLSFLKNESKFLLLKSFKYNSSSKNVFKILFYIKYSKIRSYSRRSYLRNRCNFTGRSYGILRKFNLSRFELRRESYNSNIVGFSRKSW